MDIEDFIRREVERAAGVPVYYYPPAELPAKFITLDLVMERTGTKLATIDADIDVVCWATERRAARELYQVAKDVIRELRDASPHVFAAFFEHGYRDRDEETGYARYIAKTSITYDNI